MVISSVTERLDFCVLFITSKLFVPSVALAWVEISCCCYCWCRGRKCFPTFCNLRGVETLKFKMKFYCSLHLLLFNEKLKIGTSRQIECNFYSIFLKMGQSRSLFCLFLSCSQYNFNNTNWKSLDGVLEIWNRGRMIVGADDTTELWRSPNFIPFLSGRIQHPDWWLSNCE